MNILFITSNRLGDAVLSTGLLNHITQTYIDAKLTIVCGDLPASLFEGVPGLEKIITLKKQPYNRHWIKLWSRVVGTTWDMVIDLRDSAVSRLIRARQRFVYSRHIDKKLHKVEQCAAVMGLDDVPSPKLWFTAEQEEVAAKYFTPLHTSPLIGGRIKVGGVLAIGPTANWVGKTWPAEKFITLVEQLTAPEGILPGAKVAVFAAPGEEDGAYQVLNTIPPERQIDVIAKENPGTAAAILSRCDFYVGNDSGLMHCAAAAGVPTVGLFGPSYPHLYRPWGSHCAYVSTPETFDELTDFDGYDPKTLDRSLMTSLSVDQVVRACEVLRAKT